MRKSAHISRVHTVSLLLLILLLLLSSILLLSMLLLSLTLLIVDIPSLEGNETVISVFFQHGMCVWRN